MEDYEGRYSHGNLSWPEDEEELVLKIENVEDLEKESSSDNIGVNEDPLNLADLNLAKQRFKTFLQSIGELKKTHIREDILRYCDAYNRSEKHVEMHCRPESLIKKIQIRIEKYTIPYNRMLKTKRIKRNWGEEDLKILIWVISKYCDVQQYVDLQKQITNDDWKMMATLIPGVTADSCMFKWLSLKKITLATNNWTSEQSSTLSQIVKERLKQQLKHSAEIKDWKEISQELYTLNHHPDKCYRNAKQCREHWTCYLSPMLKKGPWQLYEDVKLLRYIKDNKGMKKWSEIAKNFDGRTENALKNRYTLIIEKQKKSSKSKSKNQLDLISDYLEKCYVDQFTVEVRPDRNEIYEEESQIKPNEVENRQTTPLKSKIKDVPETNDFHPITPVRVQKVNMADFDFMSAQFLKNIQPGVMEANGTFKKVHKLSGSSSTSAMNEWPLGN